MGRRRRRLISGSGQEASSGTVLDGVGLGLVTGFLARADSLAARPASLMCVLFPTFSDYSPTIPGIRSPQAGNPLSLRVMPYPPRERCVHTRTHIRYVRA